MNDTAFYSTVTGRTKRNQVIEIVGDFYQQIVSPSVDVVNIKSATAGAALVATEATDFVSFDNTLSYLRPQATVRKHLASAVVGMIRPNHHLLSALMGAETTTALNFTGECTERLFATFTRKLLRRGYQLVSTWLRTCLLTDVPNVVDVATDDAFRGLPVHLLPSHVAFTRAKTANRSLLVCMIGPQKLNTALGASKRFGANLGSVLARFAAVNGFSIIRLECFAALGAHLEHR